MKNETGVEVAETLSKIFKKRRPEKIWVDKGKEFYNKTVKALGVELYSTENEEKSCVVERWNRTMKEKMYKYFTANSTGEYLHVLDEMVGNYNSTRHSSIKITPVAASDKKNESVVWMNLHSQSEPTKVKFKVGDRVRITKKKTFSKSLSRLAGLKKFLSCHKFNTQTLPHTK